MAAVTGPLRLEHGSWAAAFLVLILGVAQFVMGHEGTASSNSGHRSAWVQLGCWNAGGAAVIVATLVEGPWLVDVGSVVMLVALGLALVATRGRSGRWAVAYRAALLLSIPVGIVLAHLRHG